MFWQNNFSGNIRKEGGYNMCVLYTSFSIFFFFGGGKQTCMLVYTDTFWEASRKTEFF